MRRAGVSSERRGRLTALLEEWRRDLRHGLRELREQPAVVAAVRDTEEEGSDDFARDLDVALLEARGAMLAQLNEALRRLDEGTYGLCAGCGTQIGEGRLSALPFATLCHDCQEREEGDEGRKRRKSLDADSLQADHA